MKRPLDIAVEVQVCGIDGAQGAEPDAGALLMKVNINIKTILSIILVIVAVALAIYIRYNRRRHRVTIVDDTRFTPQWKHLPKPPPCNKAGMALADHLCLNSSPSAQAAPTFKAAPKFKGPPPCSPRHLRREMSPETRQRFLAKLAAGEFATVEKHTS